jgi:L-fuculose-phosphate aldolase
MYHALAQKIAETGAHFGPRAIVHAHSKHTVFRSFIAESITPIDSEGKLILGSSVPILAAEQTIASPEVAGLMAQQILEGKSLAVIKGHGSFALADSLKNAYRLVSCLEYSAELLTLFETTGHKHA